MIDSFLNKLLTFINETLMMFKGLPLWQIALMIILPDVLVIAYMLIIKRTRKGGVE